MDVDEDRLRATIEHLAAIERPSASAGERAAAEWIAGRLRDEGLDARIEEERAHGTYWVPLGLMTAAAAAAGLGARGPRRRALAVAVGAAAALGVADDVSAGPHVFRRLLPHGSTANVVAVAGDREAAETLVFLAHHDAAHAGLVFAPILVEAPADRFPRWYATQDTSPQVMRLVAAAPALVALGAALGIGPVRALGTTLSLAAAAAFAEIGARGVVPGANDNLAAVAVLIELARLLRERPVRGLRVLLVSTGSEESFMEGMRGFARRHFPSLPPERTRIICLETLGSPELIVTEGEGMIRMRDYPSATREDLAAAAARLGIPVRRGLRAGLASDGLIALKAGYRSAMLASVTKYKFPSHYHSRNDTAENVDYGTVVRATRICEELIRSG